RLAARHRLARTERAGRRLVGHSSRGRGSERARTRRGTRREVAAANGRDRGEGANGVVAPDCGLYRMDRSADGRGQLVAGVGGDGRRREPLRRGGEAFAVDEVGGGGRGRSRRDLPRALPPPTWAHARRGGFADRQT